MTDVLAAPDVARPTELDPFLSSHGAPESPSQWRQLIDASPVATVVADLAGRIRYLNPAARTLLGITAPDGRVTVDGIYLAGRFSSPDFAPDGHHDVWDDIARDLRRGRSAIGRRCRLRRSDASHVPIVLHASPVRWDGAAAVQLQFRDVRQQQAAEQREQNSRVRWEALFDSSPVAIGLSDEQGRFVHANPALCTLLGRPLEQLLGRTSLEFTHPADRHVNAGATRLIAGASDGVAQLEKRYVRPDGEIRFAWLSATHVPGPDGDTWTLAHIQDVTERQLAEQRRRESESDLAAVAEVVRAIQTEADARGTVVEAARRLAGADVVWLVEPDHAARTMRITAGTDDFLLGLSAPISEPSLSVTVLTTGEPIFVLDPVNDPRVSPTLLAKFQPQALFTLPVRSHGVTVAVLAVAWLHDVAAFDDRRVTMAAMLADQAAVALRQAFLLEELQQLSRTDALTALPNRRHWDESLVRTLAQSRRSGTPCTVALADLDHFKRFNDTQGHAAGDVLLREFADTARETLRVGDELARWGGEEFAIALPDCPTSEASTVLDRIRASVPRGQTCSIGYATWDGRESAEELLLRADRALYAAKAAGRDRVVAAAGTTEPARPGASVPTPPGPNDIDNRFQ